MTKCQGINKKMDCNQQTFIISIQKHRTQIDQPKQTRFKNSKSIFFFFLLIIFIIITSSMLLISMNIKNQRPKQLNSSLSRADFLTSLQLAIDELNNTIASITKALSSSISSSPLAGPRLSVCQKSMHDSLSRLNGSLGLLGFDSDVESLTYEEMDYLWVWGKAFMDDVEECFLKLEEMDDMMVDMGGEDEKMIMGVEEVKLGVVKAKKFILNSILLYDYSFDHNFLIGYKFLIGMYFLIYLVLAFLYFLMWNNK